MKFKVKKQVMVIFSEREVRGYIKNIEVRGRRRLSELEKSIQKEVLLIQRKYPTANVKWTIGVVELPVSASA